MQFALKYSTDSSYGLLGLGGFRRSAILGIYVIPYVPSLIKACLIIQLE